MDSPPDGLSTLTQREREVAALVAEGLTNRQIAERLFISERTADGHLEHIREKLGVRSRAQITAWFIEQNRAPAPAITPVERRGGSRRPVAVVAAAIVVVLLASIALIAATRLGGRAQAGGPAISTAAGLGKPGPTGGGYSGDGGPATAAQLRRPLSVASAPDGSLYIAEDTNGAVRRVEASGVITTVVGGNEAPFKEGALGASVSVGAPRAVAMSGDGRLYICTHLGVFRLDRDETLHLLIAAPAAPWPGSFAGLAIALGDVLFISDRVAHTVLRLAPDGGLRTYAGTGEPGSSGDGGAATGAQLEMPTALAVDSKGDLFIADPGNNRVRRVDAATGAISTVAGSNDIYGFGGDGGPATRARLSLPTGVAVDAADNLYVADTGNNRVRKVSRAGRITSFVGSGSPGSGGDGGPAIAAQLFAPEGLAIDSAGNLYIADTGNNRVRKLRLQKAAGETA